MVSGNGGGYWGTNSNWTGGVPNATDAVADFSTLNLTVNSTVTNDAARTVGTLKFDDATAGNNWTLTGSNVTLATSSGTPAVNVVSSSQTTTMSVGLAGSQGFVKSGAGTLLLSGGTADTIGGTIIITNGQIQTANGASLKNVTASIIVATGAVLTVNGNFDNNANSCPIVLNGTGNGSVAALYGYGNQTMNGAITVNSDSKISHSYNIFTLNGNLTAPSGSNNLEMSITVSGQPALAVNGNVNLGLGTLTVSSVAGGAAVTLGGSNTLGGVVVQNNGTVVFGSTNAIGGIGPRVVVNDGGTAALSGTDLNPLLARVVTNSAGVVAFNGASSSTALNFGNYTNVSLGSVGSSSYSGVLTPGGGNYQLGGGGGTLTVSSGLTNLAAGLVVNGSTASSTVVLTGSHTYTNATIITGGTLMVTGVLAGPVVVQSGGTLAVGVANSTIGTLSVSNNVILGGSAVFAINRSGAQNADRLVASSLVLSGNLMVTNIGTAALLGDTFQLFSISGTFSNAQPTLNLPSLSGGLMWDVSRLAVDGTIKVAQITNVVGETNWPSLLAQEISSAYNAGYSNVTINPGTYIMNNGTGAAFSYSGWTNFTINASNTLFLVDTGYVNVVSGASPACFYFKNCTNMTLAGATVRPKVYPFTQGRVTAIGTNGGVLYCNWQISDGYPTNFEWWFNAVYASNSVVNLTQGDIYYGDKYGINSSGVATNAVYLGNRTWQINFPSWLTSFSFQTNDWLVARANPQGFAYYLNGCSNVTLSACSSQSGGFGTFRENYGGGNHMLGCQIQSAPVPPAGGTELPVVGCAADGLHTIWTYPGMDLENFVTQGVMLDDCVTFHGDNNNVVTSSGNTVTFDGAGMFVVGDPVRIYSTNGTYFAQANCTAIQSVGSGNYQLTLDQSLTIPAGTAGENPKYNGAGYKVINCQLGNVRSRAILNKADNGLITGCTIQNAQTAMQFGPETYWGGGGYSWNLNVTNNIILHCGNYGIQFVTAGAIGNLTNTIQNNYFQDVFLGDDINFSGCGGVTITGNIFANPSAGNNPVYLSKSTNIVLLKNFVTNNAAGVSFIGQGSGVTNLQNQQTGIILAGVPYAVTSQFGSLVMNDPSGGGTGTQVVQQTPSGADSEHWVPSPTGNGYCVLVCVANGLVVGVNGSIASNAPVIMEAYSGADSQLWALTPVTNNYLAMINKLSGMAVHTSSGSSGLGLVQRPFVGSTNQQWSLAAAPTGNNYSWDSDGNAANGVTDGSGTWDGVSSLWFRSTNGIDTSWPGAAGIAVFGSSGTGTVTISGTQNVAGLVFNTAYTLNGGAISASTNVVLVVSNSANATISSLLAGSQNLTKFGNGTLTISGNNNYTGGTIQNAGIITISNNSNALGNGIITINAGSSRLIINDNLNVTNSIVINGGGTTGHGILENSGTGNATLSGGIITLNGSAGAGGHLGDSTGGTLTVNDFIASTVPVTWRVGTGIFGGGGSYTNFQQSQDTVKLGAANGLATNSVLLFVNANSSSCRFDLAGCSQALVGLTQRSAANNLVTNSANAIQSVLTLSNPGGTNVYATNTFYGVIGGNMALTINGGSFTLTNLNTYNGATTISGGTLALSGVGTIANTPLISVGNGATFDVSGLNSTFVLGSSQTLSNGASSTGGVKGSLNASGKTVSVSYTNGTPALAVTSGTLTLTAATVFTIDNTGPALSAGSYLIVSTNTGGLVSGTAPSAVTVTDGGLAAGSTASLSISGGQMNLVVTSSAVTPPSILPVYPDGTGTNLVLRVGTVAGHNYLLESATNLTPPISWITNSTTAGTGGTITNTLPITHTPPNQFFRYLVQ